MFTLFFKCNPSLFDSIILNKYFIPDNLISYNLFPYEKKKSYVSSIATLYVAFTLHKIFRFVYKNEYKLVLYIENIYSIYFN